MKLNQVLVLFWYQLDTSPCYNFVVRLKSHYRHFHHFLREYPPFWFVLVLLRHKFYYKSPTNPMFPTHSSLDKLIKYIRRVVTKNFSSIRWKNILYLRKFILILLVWNRLHNDNHYQQGKFRCYSFVVQRIVLSMLFHHFPRVYPLFLS